MLKDLSNAFICSIDSLMDQISAVNPQLSAIVRVQSPCLLLLNLFYQNSSPGMSSFHQLTEYSLKIFNQRTFR